MERETETETQTEIERERGELESKKRKARHRRGEERGEDERHRSRREKEWGELRPSLVCSTNPIITRLFTRREREMIGQRDSSASRERGADVEEQQEKKEDIWYMYVERKKDC